MLAEQLSIIRKNSRTHLTYKKSEITFIDDEDASKEMIYELIKHKSVYTKRSKLLNFDRHGLSANDEAKFSIKFNKYLVSLLEHIKEDDIEYLLEFLVRVYSIETFNPNELIFLLLPMEDRFEDQIFRLIKHQKTNFSNLLSLSFSDISKVFISNYVNFGFFVKYFYFYSKHKIFLNGCLEHSLKRLQHSKLNYLSEFTVIFNKMKNQGGRDEAIRLYNKYKVYFKATKFNEFMDQF